MKTKEQLKIEKALYDQERKKNPVIQEKRKEQSKTWYQGIRKKNFTANPRHYLWYVAKVRAKQKGVEFTITEEDIIIPEYCPILQMKLTTGGDGYRQDAMSLDRVDNSKGYIPGNVRIISRWANLKKSSMTIEELERIIKYMKGEI